MPAYVVSLSAGTAAPLPNGAKNAVVFAEDAAAARTIAASGFSTNRGREAGYMTTAWSEASVTEIVAAADLTDIVLSVSISNGVSEEVVGGATDVVDDLAAAMVTALNGNASIANASYDAGTNILTAAGAADSLGDQVLTVSVTRYGVPISGFVGTITDEGAAGAALTVQLGADAVALPQVVALF